jgi:hypothetical protein
MVDTRGHKPAHERRRVLLREPRAETAALTVSAGNHEKATTVGVFVTELLALNQRVHERQAVTLRITRE